MTNAHHNHENSTKSTGKLGIVSLINLVGFVIELAGGLLFGSISLLSDAFHMLFDATAYSMAFFSAYMSERMEGNSSWSYGFHRLETLSAFFNGALLIPMAAYIVWESYRRFLAPVEIGIIPTIAIGGGGLVVNLFSIYFLQGGEMSLNEKGAFYHLLGDTGGSMGVIISAGIIHFTGFKAVDPIAAVLIAGTIVWSSIKVLGGSTSILLHRSPVDSDRLRVEIEELPNVGEVRDFRVWNICSRITVATLHVCDNASSLNESAITRGKIRNLLREEGVDHATIEMEGSEENACQHSIQH